MSVNHISSCFHNNHLFEKPLCDALPTVQKVINVFFHVLTLGLPLAIYHIVACILPRKGSQRGHFPGNRPMGELPKNDSVAVEDHYKDSHPTAGISEQFKQFCLESINKGQNNNSGVTQEEVNEFFARGGNIEIVREGGEIHELSRSDIYSTGCSSGVNRSQTMRAFLVGEGCDVRSVIAGGDSGANPNGQYHILSDFDETEQEHFQRALKRGQKIPQLGRKEFGVFCESSTDIKRWYQEYFNTCEENHFVTFSHSGLSVLKRLLGRGGCLEGVTITHLPWGDEINHPPAGADFEAGSEGSYRAFYNKIKNHIRVVD